VSGRAAETYELHLLLVVPGKMAIAGVLAAEEEVEVEVEGKFR
jgi:hypothetical protein